MMELSPLEGEAIVEHIQQKFPEKILTIFLVGSYAEGLAMSGSDVDLVVVLHDEVRVEGPDYIVEVLGGKRYEVLLVRESKYIALIRPESSISAGRRMSLHKTRKLICGVPIFGETAAARLLKEHSVERLASTASNYFHGEAARWFDSFIRFYVDSRADEAFYCIRMSLSESAEGVLVRCGDLYFKEQWRIARVRRTFPRYRGLAPLTDFVSEGIAGYMSQGDVLEYSAQCALASTWLSLVSVCPDLRDAEVPMDWRQHLAETSRSLHPFSLAKRREGRILLRSMKGTFEVSVEIARAIGRCAFSIPDGAVDESISSFVNKNMRRI
ncbi:nucleotidyltransferase domain-containing protein [Burkholderia ambifaria]|uniref:nucleotidyltransferase domain-containing protein n=1 Tax=Burkholderia ambifaria TaxID=152480 RepID=UPI0013E0CCE1|nr:nucleotidyltransferase domain-containing protein [Burkholderia ambifaria]